MMTEAELDGVIDGALGSYAGEPAADLPGRVLARLRRRRRPLLPWLIGSAAAAMLIVALPVARRPEIAPPPVTAMLPAPVPAVERAGPAQARRPVAPARRKRSTLTSEERQLVAFVQANPALAERVLVEAPRQMSEPLSIAPIVVEPLAAPDLTGYPNQGEPK